MNISILLNGHSPGDRTRAIAADDRGLHYGDGLFETALLTGGRIRFLDDHLERLAAGCQRLSLKCPERATLLREIAMLTAGRGEGILKIILTRGSGKRGYCPPPGQATTRLLALHPAPEASASPDAGIIVRWCSMRLGRNPSLAGIKHLNRLEQVLARSEWTAAEVEEGLMLDTEGELVSATAGNLFLVRDGQLVTSDLRYCGIRGVMRSRVIVAAFEAGLEVAEQPLWATDLETADEVFITSSIRGIRPVARLDERQWPTGSMTRQLAAALKLW